MPRSGLAWGMVGKGAEGQKKWRHEKGLTLGPLEKKNVRWGEGAA